MTDPATGEAQVSAAEGQVVEGQAATTETEGATEVETRVVPVNVVESVRDELNTFKERAGSLETENKTLKDQMALLQANGGIVQSQQAQPTPPQEAAPVNPFQGMDPGDMPTVGQIQAAMDSLRAQNTPEANQKLTTLSHTVARLETAQHDPNYMETINKYIPEIKAINPGIVDVIRTSENPYLSALQYARTAPSYLAAQQAAAASTESGEQQPQKTIVDELNTILANQAKPSSPSALGGTGDLGSTHHLAELAEKDPAAFDRAIDKIIDGG